MNIKIVRRYYLEYLTIIDKMNKYYLNNSLRIFEI